MSAETFPFFVSLSLSLSLNLFFFCLVWISFKAWVVGRGREKRRVVSEEGRDGEKKFRSILSVSPPHWFAKRNFHWWKVYISSHACSYESRLVCASLSFPIALSNSVFPVSHSHSCSLLLRLLQYKITMCGFWDLLSGSAIFFPSCCSFLGAILYVHGV